jgi:hypothetical protein
MDLIFASCDGIAGTGYKARHTAIAKIVVDGVLDKRLADAGRAPLVMDVGLILFSEIVERGKNRIRCRLAKPAQRCLRDSIT